MSVKREDMIRPLEVDDFICYKGTTVKIQEIYNQDFFRCPDDGGDDRSYIDIEFSDEKGRYRRWRSSQGGYFTYKGNKSAIFDRFKELYKNTNTPLKVVVTILKNEGFDDKEIYSTILKVMGDLVWSE